MNTRSKMLAICGAALVAVAAGCATAPADSGADVTARQMIAASFREQGMARLDRLQQDPIQRICSGQAQPSEEALRKLEAQALSTIQWPRDGKFLGDWKEGEKLAQNGRGMTWTDKEGVPGG